LQKLNKNPDLLKNVVSEIEMKKYQKKEVTKATYEKILLEKEELAKELISCRAKMTAMQEMQKEK
jgi:hypothetical protein